MKTQELENDTVKRTVRERFGRIAEEGGSCGCGTACCSPKGAPRQGEHDAEAVALGL